MLITEKEKVKRYYQALLERDQSFLGIFYVGVKTTSVFCVSTCRARKPKFENVEFFTDFKDALAHGYRPCKICKPTENAHETPEQVNRAIDLIRANPKDKISDFRLRQENISPEMVRRWFNKNYGITFQAYQRMYRINSAFEELRSGRKSTTTAFDSGFESLSGFGYTYKKLIGKSPAESRKSNVILIHRFTTPLGPMFTCSTAKGICLLEFVDRRALEIEFRDLQRLLKATIIVGENKHTTQVKEEIKEYFDGKRGKFDVALDTPGTNFQQRVWQGLVKVRFGETTSYQSFAESLGDKNATRAVASANGNNRIAIIIPCHRVVGKNGDLRGYGGGIERKRWLLDHEERTLVAQRSFNYRLEK
ncbi:MAG: methylated-DNA--[protein]-cysteine S-methyltransferase [Bacteroidota bacterium]